MGGSSFGKVVTKVVDPFNLGNSKFVKSARKIIDPLNIMDPLNVLPGSGKPVGTWDKNFGAPVMNWLNPKQSSYAPMTKGVSNDPKYFAQQQQMVADMQLKNQANQLKQQAQLSNLRSQLPSYSTSASSPSLTQAPQATQAPQTAKTSTTPATLAQSKIDDTTALSDMPTEFIYKPSTAKIESIAANTFQMPDMSNIKFGGV
jgi:hypothetical protein